MTLGDLTWGEMGKDEMEKGDSGRRALMYRAAGSVSQIADFIETAADVVCDEATVTSSSVHKKVGRSMA